MNISSFSASSPIFLLHYIRLEENTIPFEFGRPIFSNLEDHGESPLCLTLLLMSLRLFGLKLKAERVFVVTADFY